MPDVPIELLNLVSTKPSPKVSQSEVNEFFHSRVWLLLKQHFSRSVSAAWTKLLDPYTSDREIRASAAQVRILLWLLGSERRLSDVIQSEAQLADAGEIQNDEECDEGELRDLLSLIAQSQGERDA